MISLIIKLINRWRCKHSYRYLCFDEKTEDNVTYHLRLYRCDLCGKYIWIDSRRDIYR